VLGVSEAAVLYQKSTLQISGLRSLSRRYVYIDVLDWKWVKLNVLEDGVNAGESAST